MFVSLLPVSQSCSVTTGGTPPEFVGRDMPRVVCTATLFTTSSYMSPMQLNRYARHAPSEPESVAPPRMTSVRSGPANP